MAKYLGQTPIETPNMEPAELALMFISSYGQIDGAHHKAWVLDQVARVLKGTKVLFWEASWDDGTRELRFSTEDEPTPEYRNWVALQKHNPVDPEDEYTYDEGIAP